MPPARATEPPRPATPPAGPAWITPELIAETIRVWQPYCANELTRADALEIVLNVGRLFGVLSEGARLRPPDGPER